MGTTTISPLLKLIAAYLRNSDTYHSHHLHLTFEPRVGAELYDRLGKGKITAIDLPLNGDNGYGEMFAKTKRQYLTTVVFSSAQQLMDELNIYSAYLVDGESVIGWKLEGVVFTKLEGAPRPVDFCYVEYHRKAMRDSSCVSDTVEKLKRAIDEVAADGPLNEATMMWSYSLKNETLMTAQRIYELSAIDWFVERIPKFEVCYYEEWVQDYEKEWKIAQTKLAAEEL